MRAMLYARDEPHAPLAMETDEEADMVVRSVLARMKQELVRRRNVASMLWSVRALNLMRRYRLQTVGDLVEMTWGDVLRLEGFGIASINEVARELGELGFQGTGFQVVAEAGQTKQAAEQALRR